MWLRPPVKSGVDNSKTCASMECPPNGYVEMTMGKRGRLSRHRIESAPAAQRLLQQCPQRFVYVAPVADVIDIERALFLVQPIDDPVAARFERAVAGEIAGQLRAPAWILTEIVDGGADELLDFGRELGNEPRGFGGKADAEHASAAEDILVGQPLAGAALADRFLQGFHRRLVAQNIERLDKPLERLHAEDHRGGHAVLGDGDRAVLLFPLANELQQLVFRFGDRHIFVNLGHLSALKAIIMAIRVRGKRFPWGGESDKDKKPSFDRR